MLCIKDIFQQYDTINQMPGGLTFTCSIKRKITSI